MSTSPPASGGWGERTWGLTRELNSITRSPPWEAGQELGEDEPTSLLGLGDSRSHTVAGKRGRGESHCLGNVTPEEKALSPSPGGLCLLQGRPQDCQAPASACPQSPREHWAPGRSLAAAHPGAGSLRCWAFLRRNRQALLTWAGLSQGTVTGTCFAAPVAARISRQRRVTLTQAPGQRDR